MKLTFTFKKQATLYLLLISCLACVKDGDFELPESLCQDQLEPSITLTELYTMAGEDLVKYKTDDLLEAYVVSSDQQGNFFKTISFQNLEGTLGFSIPIDQTDLYTLYNPGDRVLINLLDLYVKIDKGALEIGAFFVDTFGNETIGRIGKPGFEKHIQKMCTWVEEDQLINTLSINQINDSKLNTLIAISSVQFTEAALGQHYYEASLDNAGATDHIIQDVSKEKLVFRTSAFADYAKQAVPEGNGTIKGVLSKYKGAYQLIARGPKDVDLNLPRKRFGFADQINGEHITIAQLRTQFTGSDLTLDGEQFIEGIITLSGFENGNILDKEAYLQDDTGAISLVFAESSTVLEGYYVKVNLKNKTLGRIDGLLGLAIHQDLDVQFIAENSSPPVVKKLSLTQLLSGQFESQLVQVDSVQFENEIGIFQGEQVITDCIDLIPLITQNTASFAQDTYPNLNGSIFGLASNNGQPYLLLRSAAGTQSLNNERCQINTESFNKIFFSELADPNNNSAARFIEIYNAGSNAVNLNGWLIKRYTNDNSSSSASINLSGSIIQAGQAFVIAAQGSAFEAAFGFSPNLVAGTGGPADSNGDDNLELVAPDGSIIDIFGMVGQDGSGTNHEFEDGRALRNSDINVASAVYLFEQWQIWNDTGAAGTINAPQDAPGAFSPGLR